MRPVLAVAGGRAAHIRAQAQWKWRTLRRRVLLAVLGRGPVRRLLHRRASAAWSSPGQLTFVCYGNICRSPFAGALLRRPGRSAREVVSAGTYPRGGRSSPIEAVVAARDWSVELEEHRSRVLDTDAGDASAAIFVFDIDNLATVRGSSPGPTAACTCSARCCQAVHLRSTIRTVARPRTSDARTSRSPRSSRPPIAPPRACRCPQDLRHLDRSSDRTRPGDPPNTVVDHDSRAHTSTDGALA